MADALSRLLQRLEEERERFVALVVHLNDTYLIDERAGRLPGFPRLIATTAYLRDHVKRVTGLDDRVLVVHSGDFIGPSLLSNADKGAAMCELLDRVGLAYGVPGNHEFDYGAENLAERLKERQRRFKLVCANSKDPTGLVPVLPGAFWPDARRPLVALTGVVSKSVHKSFRSPANDEPFAESVPWSFEPPNQALLSFLEETKDVPFRIVLSHATQLEDRQLRRELPALARTYMLGGHDHDIEWVEDDRELFIMKSLANLETVRVCLLLAAGQSVMAPVGDRAIRLANRRTAGIDPESVNDTLQYPADVEALLLPTFDIDRVVIEKELAAACAPAAAAGITLDAAVKSLRYRPDMVSFKLTYSDHRPASQQDAGWVTDTLAQLPFDNLSTTVRDFSQETRGRPLEARESRIRRRQTDFGGYIADCIRLHGGADVAILNAGAFRSDSLIGPRLLMTDLLEAFLYDTPDAIVTLELESDVVDALIAHGLSRIRQGAYCQLSDKRKAGAKNVIVAIAKYLVADERSIDGFDAVLARTMNPSDAANARQWAFSSAIKRFSVVQAVTCQAAQAQLGASTPADGHEDLAEELIGLLKTYADTFFQSVEKEGALSPQPTQRQRDQLFREWLGSDLPLASQDMQAARDGVRARLRALPAVAAIDTNGGPSGLASLEAAGAELMSMRAIVAEHDFAFRDGANYGWMFDLVARGLPGWDRR